MIENSEIDVAEIGVRLVDDAYLAWFSAESESERALQLWFENASATAYFAYRAALDREQAAARDLQRLWDVSEPCRQDLMRRKEGISK
jgi:hypothetical protein